MSRLACLLAVSAAGCYHVDNSDCAIRCGADGACPTGLTCARGFCVAEDQVCQDPDLVLAYSFDELDNATFRDESGHANHAAVETVTLGPGVHGRAAIFDGNSRLITSHDPSLAVAPGGAFTVSFWIDVAQQPSLPSDQLILGKVRDNAARIPPFYELGIEFDNVTETLELFLGTIDELRLVYAVTVPYDRFTHVTFTWDGTTVEGYVDGDLQPFTPEQPIPPIMVPDAGKDLFIGGQPDSQELFRGGLDDVRLYRRVLTADEITADGASGVSP